MGRVLGNTVPGGAVSSLVAVKRTDERSDGRDRNVSQSTSSLHGTRYSMPAVQARCLLSVREHNSKDSHMS